MNWLMRYKWVILFVAADIFVYWFNPALGTQIAQHTSLSILEMLGVIPPIFILLGLLDTWVPREKVVSHLGAGSGLRGLSLAMALGAACWVWAAAWWRRWLPAPGCAGLLRLKQSVYWARYFTRLPSV